ncbi:MAG: ATP-binding protein [Acidimicrobiales bacterium]
MTEGPSASDTENWTELGGDARVLDLPDPELRAQAEQARLLESVGQLAGGVAHDFNNLLGVILNYAAFVNDAVAKAAEGPDGERWLPVQDDVRHIQQAAERAAVLTRQLLTFAHRDTGRPELLSLNESVKELEPLLASTVGEHVDLCIRLEDELWPVSLDPDQLEELLIALTSNAGRATAAGGSVTVDTRNETVDELYASRHPVTPGRYVRVRVSDTGVGMDTEVLDRAFSPFFTTKPAGEGPGLGLAVVHGIVQQAGGNIHIYSEVGFGTTVSVLLPAAERSASPARDTRDGVEGGEVILLVDDEDAMRESARRILESRGYKVLPAASASEAIRLASEPAQHIDLLLTDVIMPESYGHELSEVIRQARPGLCVLYMSGYALQLLSSRGILAPGIELIEKPFSESALLTKVRRVLDA